MFLFTAYYKALTAFFLRSNLLRNQALLVRLLFLLSVGILLTACASSSGRSNVFSHSSYNFVGLNTTLTSAPQEQRILGRILLDITEVALNLPSSMDAASISGLDFQLEGSELAQQFYEVNGSGVVHFSGANDYRRIFNLGYVVDELEVSDFSVKATVFYATADGVQTQWVTRAPVRVAAVGGDANSIIASRFVEFKGVNRGLVNATLNRSFTGRFEAARAIAENDAVVFLQSDSVEALVNASDMNYNASANEADVDFFAREEERGELGFADLARAGNVTQTLRAQILLTLNRGRPTERTQRLTYTIAARTPLSVVNGNASVSGSFLHLLNQSDQAAPEDYLNATGTGYGANVSTVEVSFRFGYEREVLEARPADASNQALRYRVSGSIEENSLGGRVVNALGNLLSSLGIEARLPSDAAADGYPFLPTLYYRLENVNNATSSACKNRYYVDHQSGWSVRVLPWITAAYALNYEDEAQRVNPCRLQASLNGVQYEDVRTAADADFSLARALEGRTPPEANSPFCANNVTAARAGACRYAAEVDISLLDVNEAPRLAVTPRVSNVSEGDVGSASGFAAADLEVIAGEAPSSLTGELRKLADLAYEDRDEDRSGAALRASGAPQIVSVLPRLPAGAENLFVINEVAGRDNESELFLNQTLLRAVDYETLQASGHSGYSLRLRVRDNSTAGLTDDEEFVLGIEDVVYKPVLVGDGYAPTSNVSEQIQQILPGFQQFVFNGGPFLGRLQALDPESNSSVGIAYRYVGIELNAGVMTAPDSAKTALETTLGLNFAVAGDRLNLIGLGLREVTTDSFPNLTAPADVSELPVDFNVQARAFNPASGDSAPASAGRLIEIETKVAHNEDLSPPLPLARFAQGMYEGRVAEGQTGDGTVEGVPVLNLTGDVPLNLTSPSPPSEVEAFYRLVSEEEVLAAISSLQPQLRASLAALFTGAAGERLFDLSGSEAFAIDSATGEIYLENNYRVDFSERNRYVLLAQVLPRLNATSSLLSAADRFLLSDYAMVVVDVVDDNSAPEIIDLRSVASGVSVDADRISVSVRLEEGALTERVLARLRVRDDNPLPAALNFTPEDIDGQELVDSLFVVERISDSARDAAGGYSADYAVRLQRALDFETAPRVEEYHIFADDGVYVVNASGEIESAVAPDSERRVTLFLEAEILDVDEPIALRVTRDAAGTDEFGAGEEARLLETASGGLAQLVDAMGTPLADQSVYIQLADPEGRVGASNVPSYRLQVPSALDGVLSLEFDASNAAAPYFQLNITDAAGLENAGDGGLFAVSVNVAENATGLASAAVAFDLRIVNDLRQDTLTMLGALPGIQLSEQRALDLYYGSSASERRLVSGLFNLTSVHADYDEFFPGTNKHFVDLVVRRGAIEYPQDISDNVLNTDRFGLFGFAVAAGEVGRVDLLLQEGRLIDSHLLGADLRLNVSVEDRSNAVGASMEIGTMGVMITPTAPERVIFASAAAATTAFEPPAFNFGYTQSEFATALAMEACAGEEARANISIDGRCYATIEVRGPSDERLDVVKRLARSEDQIVYTGDLAVALSSTERPRELGIIFTDAAVEIMDLGVYRLTASGDLEVAADFARYFELSANASYAVGGDVSRSALVISQRVYPELNRSNQDSQQVLSDGSAYLGLDLLALNATRPGESLSYFVMAGEEANSERNASRRAIAQLNIEVSAAGLNDPAFLSELKINNTPLSNSTPTNIRQADFAMLVNNLSAALSFTLVNPDGDNEDDLEAFDQNVSVLLEVVDTTDTPAGELMAAAGTASGNQLIRLGAAADASILVNTTLGDTSREFTDHPFQLARNVAGEARLRVTITEYRRDDPANAVAEQIELYRIIVEPKVDAPLSLADVKIGGADSLAEDATALTDAMVTFSLSDADFSETVSQTLRSATANITQTQRIGADTAAPSAVFTLVGESDVTAEPDRANGQASVTQAVTYADHSHGETTFALALTAQEPRGFTDEQMVVELPAFEALSIGFNVTPVNDDLAACGAGGSPLCDTLGNGRAQFVLERDFGDGTTPSPGFDDSGGPVKTVTRAVDLFFGDADLLFDPANATILPQLTTAGVSFSLTQPTSLTGITDLDQILDDAGTSAIAVETAMPGTIRATLAIELELNAAHYNTLSALPEGVSIELSAPFTDGGDPAITATATAEIRIDTASDNASVGGTSGEPTAPIDEESDPATALDVEVMIEDADLSRGGGDSYEYTLAVDGDAASDLLGWFNGTTPMTRIVNGRETGVTDPSGSITRRIRFARAPDDADVGTHSVNWTIKDSRTSIIDDNDPDRVLTGSFELEIADVVEAPVFRRADGTEVPANSLLVDGDGTARVADVNGDTARTLMDLTGADRFTVQWDQWNLPNSAYQLALLYKLNVTANAGGEELAQTYPDGGTQTPQPLLFASDDNLPPGVGGIVDVDVSFSGDFMDKPDATDEISVDLSTLSLRASDFNEDSTHSLSVVVLWIEDETSQTVMREDARQLIAVTYEENYDAPNVTLAADPGTLNRESRVNPDETPEARNQINLVIETPDNYTTDGSSKLSEYFNVKASDPAIDYGEEEPENATLAGEVHGVYVDNRTLADVSLADAGGSVSLNVWVGDLQVRKGYAIQALPCSERAVGGVGGTPCAGTSIELTRVDAIERLDDPARLVPGITSFWLRGGTGPIVPVPVIRPADIDLFFYVEERDLLETADPGTGEVPEDIQLGGEFVGGIAFTARSGGAVCRRNSAAAVPLQPVDDVAAAISSDQIDSLNPIANHTRLVSGRLARDEFPCDNGEDISDDFGTIMLYRADFENAALNGIKPQTARTPTPAYVAAIAADRIEDLPAVGNFGYRFEGSYPFFNEGGISGGRNILGWFLETATFLPPSQLPGLDAATRQRLISEGTSRNLYGYNHLASIGRALNASNEELTRDVNPDFPTDLNRLRLGLLWDLLVVDENGNYDEVPPAAVGASAFNPDARALSDVPHNDLAVHFNIEENVYINSSLDLSLDLSLDVTPPAEDIVLDADARNDLEWYTKINWLLAKDEPNHFLVPLGTRGRSENRGPPFLVDQIRVVEAANNASHFMRFASGDTHPLHITDETPFEGGPHENFTLSAEVCEFPFASLDNLTAANVDEDPYDLSDYRRGRSIDCPAGTGSVPAGFLDGDGELVAERLLGLLPAGDRQTADIAPPPLLQSSLLGGSIGRGSLRSAEFRVVLNLRGDLLPPAEDGGPKDYLVNLIATDIGGVSNYINFIIRIRPLNPPPPAAP